MLLHSTLIIANIVLAFQDEEKEKRAVELVIADIEPDFQNKEKEKREIANKELEVHFKRPASFFF